MLRLTLIAIGLTAMFSCEQKQMLSYTQGLANCDSLVQKNREESPGSFIRVGPDCMLGAQMPEFSFETIDGLPFSRESLLGKVSVINFWFITCPPCVAEIPGFNALVDQYESDEINFVAIGRDKERDIEEFLKTHPWSFTQISGGEKALYETFNIRWGFPTTFVLNKDAEIIFAVSGGKTDETASEEIQNTLNPILQQYVN